MKAAVFGLHAYSFGRCEELDLKESIDLDLVAKEWPQTATKGIYLNSGSCGVKPVSVLKAVENGWNHLNENPTLATFVDMEPWEQARTAAAKLFNAPAEQIMLTQNSTYGIQLVMQSLLLEPGDEFISTNMEHGCVAAISSYLRKERGIIHHSYPLDAFAGSDALTKGILALVNSRTRLVLVSQINCLNGWRPHLDSLLRALDEKGVPLLVDGAHGPGQGPLKIVAYPFWVASAHKWLGAPNGTGFLKVRPDQISKLKPVIVGDRFFNSDYSILNRFEWPGTCDVVKLMALKTAIELQNKLGPEKIAARQKVLHKYLRDSVASKLPGGLVRTPFVEGEVAAIYAIAWNESQLKTKDLRDSLWRNNQIWIQPDFVDRSKGGFGMRISCHIFNTESQIDELVQALKPMFK